MSELHCSKCPFVAKHPWELRRHNEKKKPCGIGNYSCNTCHKKFISRSGLWEHQQHNRCPGPPAQTSEQKDKEIRDLRVALDAVRGMGEVVTQTDGNRPIVNVNIVNPVFNQTDITNIQNNIVVNVAGEENIDYIRAMSLDGFKQAIGGLTPSHSTVSNMFKLVRINEDHPENHNLLLPDRDGDMIHWKSKDGWKTMKFDDKIRGLVSSDILNVLDSKIRGPDRDTTFYWGYIIHEILRKCGEMDHAGLKPIYDDIRDPLHEQTIKYAQRFKEASIDEQDEPSNPAVSVAATDSLNLDDVRIMMNKLQVLEKQLMNKNA